MAVLSSEPPSVRYSPNGAVWRGGAVSCAAPGASTGLHPVHSPNPLPSALHRCAPLVALPGHAQETCLPGTHASSEGALGGELEAGSAGAALAGGRGAKGGSSPAAEADPRAMAAPAADAIRLLRRATAATA